MTREELFRAVGEVREDQVTEAETVRKQGRPWRRYGALAACFAVALAAGIVWNQMYHTGRDLPAAGQIETGGTGDAGAYKEDSHLDGAEYSAPEDAAARLLYSTNVQWAELDFEGLRSEENGETPFSSSACLAWVEPEELLAMDTAVFRGTVRDIRYAEITSGSYQAFYTVVTVEVTDCVRGGLGAGDIYNILYTGVPGYHSTSISGDLNKLEIGSDAVFMPYWSSPEAGWMTEDGFFAYIDLAELYFDEGIRFLFLDTGDGLSFDRAAYADIADAETLDEVMDYLREHVPNADQPPETAAEVFQAAGEPPETAQAAQTPAEPQAEPSSTAEAFPAGIRPGPAGARELPGELPGGAFVSD